MNLPSQHRRDVFEATAQRLGTLATYVEKDFWVCLGSIAALDLFFGVRERMLYDYLSRGFRAEFGFMLGNYRDR